MHKFGIFLIDDMVEYLGFDLCGQERWHDFARALATFSQSNVAFVRQAAVYGIGVFAASTPSAVFQQHYT